LDDHLGMGELEWISPLAEDDYTELRDEVWGRLDLPGPSPQEAGFWPRRGPQWDATAVVGGRGGGCVLVEAKAAVGEDRSVADTRTQSTLKQRRTAMAEAQRHMGATVADWTAPRYQLANRLTHLYYLRARLGFAAWLALIYFVDESSPTPGGGTAKYPRSASEWEPEIHSGWEDLGLERGSHPLAEYVIELFLPVSATPTTSELARSVPAAHRSEITAYWASR
jgi:hypothetical protein